MHTISPAQPTTLTYDQIPHSPLRFLWHPYIPLGKITLLIGHPGSGKSLLSLHLAASLSRALPLPTLSQSPPSAMPQANVPPQTPTPIDPPNPSHPPTLNSEFKHSEFPPSSTLLLAAEDDPHDTIRPRLESLTPTAQSLSLIHHLPTLHSLIPPKNSALSTQDSALVSPLSLLDHTLSQNPSIKLLIIDPLTYYLGQSDHLSNMPQAQGLNPCGSHRSTLYALSQLAAKHHIAILATTRLTKIPSPSLLHRAAGSHAFTALARSVLLLTHDPQSPDSNRRLLIPLKHNLTAAPPTLSFQINSSPNTCVPTLAWEEAPVPLTPHEISQLTPEQLKPDSSLDLAAEWLSTTLANGPLPSKTLRKDAAENGIPFTTLSRAKSKLAVISRKEKNEKWWWKLPADSTPIPPPPKSVDEDIRELEKMLASFDILGFLPPGAIKKRGAK